MAKHILIVDDSPSVRQMVRLALLNAGYEVTEACDGLDGLAKLEAQRIHLIISDVNMPEMDGIAFLKAVKAHPRFRFTPFIMLTTESQEALQREGRAAGAKAWLLKPFRPEQVIGCVSKLLLPD